MRNDELFYPRHMSSWWTVLEDILYPEKRIQDKIRRRAAKFAEAGFDSVMQFGFHTRFDYAPYFGALHAYYAAVANELHSYGIKFVEHFSCNVVARPRDSEERLKYHRSQRHHVALYPDEIARETMQYEGCRYNSIRSINIATGLPSYAAQYQCEFFCHNNPDFRAMVQKYLRRYLSEVPVDGVEVDDMAIYDGFRSCGCSHCRERFRREYGITLPPVDNHDFWGDTLSSPYSWGNYANPDFRSWVQMRFKTTSEHFALIRRAVDENLRLTTCSSTTGPIMLNSLGMQFESIAGSMNMVMLENNGIDVSAADWTRTEPEAMLQKSYARSHGQPPVVALSYANCEDGAYLGWAIARFWGVSNWTSTLIQGLAEDPPELAETSDYVGRYNTWDKANGDLDVREIMPDAEVHLVFNRHCKENGFRLPDGRDAWERISEWSKGLLARNVAYEFIREDALGSCAAMLKLGTPVILESCACLSDLHMREIRQYVEQGGALIVSGALGTHDENGTERVKPLSDILQESGVRNGVANVGNGSPVEIIDSLVTAGKIRPHVHLEDKGSGFVGRLRRYNRKVILHILNVRLEGVPHDQVKDEWATPNSMLNGLRSANNTARLDLEIDFGRLGYEKWTRPVLKSPEQPGTLLLEVHDLGDGRCRISADVSRIKLYAMVCEGS